MRRAVFLDRDGTIIEDDGYISDVGRIRLFPWSAEAITRLRDAGFPIVVVTNQAGVARGYFEEAFVAEAHATSMRCSPRRAARIDAYYYCPHHPDGVVAAYTRACDCRKPAPGHDREAAADLDIDVAGSFVVGDKWLDIELAQRAGAAGVLVRTGYGQSAEAERPARHSSRAGRGHTARRCVLDSRASRRASRRRADMARTSSLPRPTAERLLALTSRFAKARVAVIGDLLADEFIYGRVERVSREAPVLILRYDTTIVVPGGAGNAANNAAALGGRVRVAGLAGRDEPGARMLGGAARSRVARRRSCARPHLPRL